MAAGTPYLAGSNTSTSTTSLTTTITGATGTGDTIILVIYNSGGIALASTPTDTQGNTYTAGANNAAANPACLVYYCLGAVPLTTSDTVNVKPASAAGCSVLVAGCSGLATASGIDVSPAAATGVSSPASITSGSLAVPGEIVFAAFSSANGSNGYTSFTNVTQIGTTQHPTGLGWLALAYASPGAATASISAQATLSSGASWSAVLISVKPAASAALSVTATASGGTGVGMALRVYALTGASPAQNGAAATQSAAAAHNASIITTVTGSQVYGAVLNGANATPTVFDAATTLIDNVGDSAHSKDYTTLKATSTTGTPGATTLGVTDSNNGGIALYEVLPAGTIAQDASGPPLRSTTTALTLTSNGFTPPAGCVLVALIAANGATNGTVTMTVSDTSGLTWTAQAQAAASNMKYAGVFTALTPSGFLPSPGLMVRQAIQASLNA